MPWTVCRPSGAKTRPWRRPYSIKSIGVWPAIRKRRPFIGTSAKWKKLPLNWSVLFLLFFPFFAFGVDDRDQFPIVLFQIRPQNGISNRISKLPKPRIVMDGRCWSAMIWRRNCRRRRKSWKRSKAKSPPGTGKSNDSRRN